MRHTILFDTIYDMNLRKTTPQKLAIEGEKPKSI
uniref:Uncharacterized protein n=1 Tax=Rhizophora mucronata TaxID=61149 RepID=A0A2P2QZC1_RHIMU